MNLAKQINKAKADIDAATNSGNREKADYIRGLAADMIAKSQAGLPEPWSNFRPMIAEEFGD